MIEIPLSCCDGPATIEPDAEEVRCDACALVHELAPDARQPRATPTFVALPAAA